MVGGMTTTKEFCEWLTELNCHEVSDHTWSYRLQKLIPSYFKHYSNGQKREKDLLKNLQLAQEKLSNPKSALFILVTLFHLKNVFKLC